MLREPVEVLPAVPAVPVPSPGGDGVSGTAAPVERVLTALLADVVGRPVTPASHFFDDLGADSMVMAQFCARARKRDDLPSPSIKDVYRHPTIHALALALAPPPPADPVEERLVGVLAEVVGRPVSPASHFFDDLGADSMVMAQFCARARKREDLPSPSIKDVYRHPTIHALTLALAPPPPADPVEERLVGVLAEVVGRPVSPASHFFDDLGADSMVMAQFCARARKRDDLPSISIKDVYRHPSVRSLAAAFRDAPAAQPVAPEPVPSGTAPPVPAPAGAPRPAPAGTAQYVLCGVLQALFFFCYCLLVATSGVAAYDWISDGGSLLYDYERSVVVGTAFFVGICVLPVLAKWLLIGRWKAEEIPVWSLRYVRFWIVKTLVQKNPMILLFNGTPMYPLYLRALGAKIGPGTAIFTKTVPVATDLLTIGAGTVIRKDTLVNGYHAHDGVIRTGPITLGRDVVIGEAAVIDIGTSMGDGAQLGHRSSLQAGQAVPAGERWHGSPAQPTRTDYRLVPPRPVSTRRRATYTLLHLCNVLLVDLPLLMGGFAVAVIAFPGLSELLDPGPLALTSGTFYWNAAVGSLVLFFGGTLVTWLVVVTVPRVLGLFMTPGRVYTLYGLHYSIHRSILRLTNAKFLMAVLGNSSWIVHYLRSLGYDLGKVVQTGSNFGMVVKHENPYLTSVGSGTVVADGLSVMNGDYSATSFRVSRTSIGADNFLGNAVYYPSEGRTGDNCLLATKVMVPIDGPVREGVGLLGSPAFEIPRTVERDAAINEHLQDPDELRRRLAAKNRHNLRTIALFLFVRWVNFFALTLITLAGFELHNSFGGWSVAAAMVVSVLFATALGILVERAVTGFRPLQPRQCSIYDPYFWFHERYWKHTAQPAFFNGTPFKPLVWRLTGVRIGRRVFDDGLGMPERTMVTIGDGCTFNAGSAVQCHSQEDAGFKSDRIVIGSGVTLGTGCWVHYGATMGDGSELAPDAFLMKGSVVPPRTRWAGNPAEEVGEVPTPLPQPTPPVAVPAAALLPPRGERVPLSPSGGRHRAGPRHLTPSAR